MKRRNSRLRLLSSILMMMMRIMIMIMMRVMMVIIGAICLPKSARLLLPATWQWWWWWFWWKGWTAGYAFSLQSSPPHLPKTQQASSFNPQARVAKRKAKNTFQELTILSPVTLNWKVTMNVRNVLNFHKGPQFSRIPFWRGSLNFVAFVFLLVSSSLFITLIKCLKGHKSLGSLL